MTDEPQTNDTMIAGLLREREGLVQRGLKDRVAQVDDQLKLRGYKPRRGSQAAKEPSEQPTPAAKTDENAQRAEPPKGRQQQPKSET